MSGSRPDEHARIVRSGKDQSRERLLQPAAAVETVFVGMRFRNIVRQDVSYRASCLIRSPIQLARFGVKYA